MKKHIILVFITLVSISCKAQVVTNPTTIIPIEEYFENYRQPDNEVPDGAYIKDVNNIFDNFLGTWNGTWEGKNYSFIITEQTYSFLGIMEDRLLMRYLITDGTTGSVLIDTTGLPDNDTFTTRGSYLHENNETYELSYGGYGCNQRGFILIALINNNTQMNLGLINVGGYNCPNGDAPPIIPTDNIVLTKQ